MKIEADEGVRLQKAIREQQEIGVKNALEKLSLDKLRLRMHRKGRSEFELKRQSFNAKMMQRDKKLSGPNMMPTLEHQKVTA